VKSTCQIFWGSYARMAHHFSGNHGIEDVLSWRMLVLVGDSQLHLLPPPTPSVSATNLTQAIPSCLSPLTRCRRRRRRIAPFSADVLNPTQPIQNVQPQHISSSILASFLGRYCPLEVFCFDRPCSRSCLLCRTSVPALVHPLVQILNHVYCRRHFERNCKRR
jgi:hypothetical protein